MANSPFSQKPEPRETNSSETMRLRLKEAFHKRDKDFDASSTVNVTLSELQEVFTESLTQPERMKDLSPKEDPISLEKLKTAIQKTHQDFLEERTFNITLEELQEVLHVAISTPKEPILEEVEESIARNHLKEALKKNQKNVNAEQTMSLSLEELRNVVFQASQMQNATFSDLNPQVETQENFLSLGILKEMLTQQNKVIDSENTVDISLNELEDILKKKTE